MSSTPLITKLPVKAPEYVIGYHGCSYSVAERILAEQRFLPSTQVYDWLGEGAYFWEFAPYRAMEWAQERIVGTNERLAVIGATIHLGYCLNLLDTEHIPALVAIYQGFVETLGSADLPRNTEQGAHYLDRTVIEAYCRLGDEEAPSPFQTLRGTFPEGGSIYPGSKILRKAHTQIAVRDQTCISDLHLVEFL